MPTLEYGLGSISVKAITDTEIRCPQCTGRNCLCLSGSGQVVAWWCTHCGVFSELKPKQEEKRKKERRSSVVSRRAGERCTPCGRRTLVFRRKPCV